MTIKEIAKLCNVSTATVSKVLNGNDHDISEATRQRVLKVAEENNYRINRLASAMVTKKTKSLGLLIPDITNSFFTDIAQGAEDAASRSNYSLFLCNTYDSLEKEMNYINDLINKQVDGIIISGAYDRNQPLEEKFIKNTPIISIDRKVYYSTIGHITTDNYDGSMQAIKHLVNLGHKHIMFLGGPKNNDISNLRYKGYVDGLKAFNLPYNKNYIRYGQFNSDFGFSSIFNDGLPQNVTAIFCGNDLIAFGVIYALRKMNIKVPEQISVVGYDDSYFASVFQPSLTTVRQPSYNLGHLAVTTLLNHLNDLPYEPNLQLNQLLVERESTTKLIEDSII